MKYTSAFLQSLALSMAVLLPSACSYDVDTAEAEVVAGGTEDNKTEDNKGPENTTDNINSNTSDDSSNNGQNNYDGKFCGEKQCIVGQLCVNGECLTGCDGDGGCKDGFKCINGGCVISCTNKDDCQDDYGCIDGKCVRNSTDSNCYMEIDGKCYTRVAYIESPSSACEYTPKTSDETRFVIQPISKIKFNDANDYNNRLVYFLKKDANDDLKQNIYNIDIETQTSLNNSEIIVLLKYDSLQHDNVQGYSNTGVLCQILNMITTYKTQICEYIDGGKTDDNIKIEIGNFVKSISLCIDTQVNQDNNAKCIDAAINMFSYIKNKRNDICDLSLFTPELSLAFLNSTLKDGDNPSTYICNQYSDSNIGSSKKILKFAIEVKGRKANIQFRAQLDSELFVASKYNNMSYSTLSSDIDSFVFNITELEVYIQQ